MIYVCIPAHNEARTLGVLLWKVRRVMKEFERDYRVVVFDDASRDDTGAVLERYRQVLPLDVLSSSERLGHGRALDRLLRHVVDVAPYPKRDVAVTVQADFTEGPEHLVPLVKSIEGGADLAAGMVEAVDAQPQRVRVLRWLAARLLAGMRATAPVRDPLCGLRGYRVVVVRKALRDRGDRPLAVESGWGANVELAQALAPYARRISDTPVTLRYDLRRRPTRMKLVPTLRQLFRVRRLAWLPSQDTGR